MEYFQSYINNLRKLCEEDSVRRNVIDEAQDEMHAMCENDQPAVGGKEAQYKQ